MAIVYFMLFMSFVLFCLSLVVYATCFHNTEWVFESQDMDVGDDGTIYITKHYIRKKCKS